MLSLTIKLLAMKQFNLLLAIKFLILELMKIYAVRIDNMLISSPKIITIVNKFDQIRLI